MSKNNSYLGGNSLVKAGNYSHPSGTRVSSVAGSPNLSGSRKMPAEVLVLHLPEVKKQIQWLVDAIDRGAIRVDCARQLRRVHEFLSDFSGQAHDVTVEIRFAYDEGRRLIQIVNPHVQRQLKRRMNGSLNE